MEEGEDDSDAVVLHQELFPCEVCGRTFAAQPLQKHRKVCEKNAIKRRKVFDSLKQRVEGTDLAPFHQKSYLKKHQPDTVNIPTETETKKNKWKEKHLELVQAIRAAKGVSTNTTMSAKRSATTLAASPANERCPSCDRHFGPKAFDRHVEWCKERKSRIQKSPASVLIAKERLEARIKYKVPPLKPRRALTREKYASTSDAVASSVRSVASSASLDRRSPAGVRKGSKSVVDVKKGADGRREKSPPGKKVEIAAAEPTNKSYNKRKPPPPIQIKLNKISVNDEVHGMTVCPLKFSDKDLEEEEKKMITWKDTLSQKKIEKEKEVEVKEKKKVKKFEKPVVTEEFLEDLTISRNLLKGPRSRTDVLLAKYKINDTTVKSKSERNLLKRNDSLGSRTNIALQKRSERDVKNFKGTSDILIEVKKERDDEEMSDLIDLSGEVEEIEICAKCSELNEQERLASAEKETDLLIELESVQNDDYIPLTRKKSINLTEDFENYESDGEEKSEYEYDDQFIQPVFEKTSSAREEFNVATDVNAMEEETAYQTFEDLVPHSPNININENDMHDCSCGPSEEAYSLSKNECIIKETINHSEIDADLFSALLIEELSDRNHHEDKCSDFDPSSDLIEPPSFFKNDENDETSEERDSKVDLIEKLIDALGDEVLNELEPGAGDHVRLDQKFSKNFEKLLSIYQKMLSEKQSKPENLVRPPSRAGDVVTDESFEKYNSKNSTFSEEGYVQERRRLETINSEDEKSLPKFNSKASIVTIESQKAEKHSVNNEKFHSQTLTGLLDDFDQHSPEGGDLISPKLGANSPTHTKSVKTIFDARPQFNLMQENQTDTLLEPRDWYFDDLESLTGAANEWTEVLSMERLNKSSLKSSHSDVCMVSSHELAKAKKLIVNIPSVVDKRDSTSAPPLLSVSSSEPVPQKRRKIECIENSLCANIDVIKQKKQEEQEQLVEEPEPQRQERVKKEKKKKRKKSVACYCDIDMTPRFKELLNFLSLNSDKNEEEVLTLSRKHCVKLLRFNAKDANGAVKLPQINNILGIKSCSREMKRSEIRLPPLNTKCTRGRRTVNPIMIVGQSCDSENAEEYNPFVSAERQLMELLQCDDFKPFTPSQPFSRPHTTDTMNNFNNNKSPTINNKTIKSADKRASVIDPPSQFEDQLTNLNDNFELIESFINDNFSSFTANNEKNLLLNNRRKYSDDMSSIDPKLINENDDLSIPDHFKSDLSDTDPFSLQYDKSISAFEPIIPKTEIIHDLKRSVSLIQRRNNNGETADDFGNAAVRLHKPKTALPKVNSFRKKQGTAAMVKSTGSLVSSSASKGGTTALCDKGKKSATPLMKRSLTVADPVGKPRNFKNKEEVHDYFNGKEKSNVTKNGRVSPEKEANLSPSSLKDANPFTIDDEMYEEYRKYEEMYLQEKQQKLKNQHKASDVVSNEDDDGLANLNKINNDSAYSSLKTSKVRARSTKLSPLQPQKLNGIESPSSSGSEMSPSSPCPPKSPQRMSRFCHECGSKYPLSCAKFCIECGVKRLVL